MARQFGLQHRPPLFHRTTAPHRLEPLVQLPALLVELLPTGLTTDDELSPATFIAVMGEAQKVKGVGAAILPLRILPFIPPKANMTALH